MKFQKVSPKQVPQVIVLGVLTLGLVGWCATQWLGGSKPADAAAAQPGGEQVAAAPAPDGQAGGAVEPGAPGAPAAPGASPASVGLGGGGGYNPDPFRSPAPKVDPAVLLKPAGPPRGAWPGGPTLPNAGGPLLPGGPGGPLVPVEPPLQRPTLSVTGIIDVEDGSDMALVDIGSGSRIVQVGDLVDTYKVKKIDMNGLLLVNGKDRYFVALASTEGAKG